MSKPLIYLTLPAIAEAIESTLSAFPYCCYQNYFTSPEQRRKLFLYILKRIRARYTVLIDDPQPSLNCQNVSLSPEQCLYIKEFAQQGICHLIPENCTRR